MSAGAQVDPWAEAAKSYKPSKDSGSASTGSNEDWKVWQQSGSDTPAGHGLLDLIRNNVNMAQKGAQPGDGMITGALKNFGAGGADVVHSIGHSLMNLGDTLTPHTQTPSESAEYAKPVGQQFGDALHQVGTDVSGMLHNPARTAGQLGVGLLAGEAGAKGLGALGDAFNAIPTRGKAGDLFNSLNTDLADHPVPLASSLKPLQRATELGVRGSTLPGPVDALLKRSQMTEPMTFPEARDYQSSLSDLSASDKLAMNKRMKGAVAQLNKSLYDDIHSSADAAGRGEDYAQAMKDYSRASTIRDVAGKAAKYGIGAAGLGIGGHYLQSLIPGR